MQVVIGSLSLDAEEPSEQIVKVEEAIKHENYRETSAAVYNDIGHLSLSYIEWAPTILGFTI